MESASPAPPPPPPTTTSLPLEVQAAASFESSTSAIAADDAAGVSCVIPSSSSSSSPSPPSSPPPPLWKSEGNGQNNEYIIADGCDSSGGDDDSLIHAENNNVNGENKDVARGSSSSLGIMMMESSSSSSSLNTPLFCGNTNINIDDDDDDVEQVGYTREMNDVVLPQSQSKATTNDDREEVIDDDSEHDYYDHNAEQHDDIDNFNIMDARGSVSWGRGRRSHSTGDIITKDADVELGGGGGGGGGRDNPLVSASTFLTSWSPRLNLQKRRYRKNSTESEGSSNIVSFSIGSGATSIMQKTLRPFRTSSTPQEEEDKMADESKNKNNVNHNFGTATIRSRPSTAICHRRYAVGEYVLISNHNITVGASTLILNASSKNLVNRYGFPEWDVGMYKTSEQRRGPYLYVLAKVVSVHFGEDAQYYTVRREDTLDYQRADAQYMEPMLHQIGIDAAKIAAKKKWFSLEDEEYFGGMESYGGHARGTGGKSDDPWNRLRPCLDSINNFAGRCHKRLGEVNRKLKQQTDACLNGKRPYGISCRFTGVNLLVVCGIWYLVIDQVRLAYLPSSMDYSCAVVSA
jgi:hypothetical protein